MQFNYNGTDIDTSVLPQVSQDALMRRGIVHFLGNEQSSKLTAFKKKFAKENEGKEPTESVVDAKGEELVAAAIKALFEGTIGQRVSSGPKITPLEKEMERLAKGEIKANLDKNNLKMPKGEETVTLAGTAYTIDDLLEIRMEKHGERLRKEAETNIRAREREARKRAEAGGDSVEALLG